MSIKRSSSKGKVEVEVGHSTVMVDIIWLIPYDHLSASCGVHGGAAVYACVESLLYKSSDDQY